MDGEAPDFDTVAFSLTLTKSFKASFTQSKPLETFQALPATIKSSEEEEEAGFMCTRWKEHVW